MTIKRSPITVGDGEWGPYRNTGTPPLLDGATITFDTVSGLASISGVFKPLSNDYPLSPNVGMQCGYIDGTPGGDQAEMLPASGVHPAGTCAVRIAGNWYPGLAFIDAPHADTAGNPYAPLTIQVNATGVMTECVVNIPPYKTVSAS